MLRRMGCNHLQCNYICRAIQDLEDTAEQHLWHWEVLDQPNNWHYQPPSNVTPDQLMESVAAFRSTSAAVATPHAIYEHLLTK